MENIINQQGHAVAQNQRNGKKSEIFIRLNISMLNAYDMTRVREKYGIEGWGIVIYIMKYLMERRTDCRAPLHAVDEIAHACHKNQHSILRLMTDFPSLFEIEAGGKVFSSPYLLQFFLKTSAKKEKPKRSLDKLTNEMLDNQEVSFSKNKNKEQEQIKDEEKEVEKADVDASSFEDKSLSETKPMAKTKTAPTDYIHFALQSPSNHMVISIKLRCNLHQISALSASNCKHRAARVKHHARFLGLSP